MSEDKQVRLVQCFRLKQELPGLDYLPLKNALGERIYREISKEAFKEWLGHSTMIINEYRLNPSEPRAQEILLEQMEKFFFGEGVEKPKEYVPPTEAQSP